MKNYKKLLLLLILILITSCADKKIRCYVCDANEKNKVSEEQLKKEEDDIINKFLDKDEEKRFRDVSKEEYNELYGKWTKSKNKTKFDEYEDENTKIWYDWEDK